MGWIRSQLTVGRPLFWNPGVLNSQVLVSVLNAIIETKIALPSVRCSAAAPPGCLVATNVVSGPVHPVKL